MLSLVFAGLRIEIDNYFFLVNNKMNIHQQQLQPNKCLNSNNLNIQIKKRKKKAHLWFGMICSHEISR